MNTVVTSNGPLPVNYEEARRALAECVRVDEVKEWKDRATAIASYAAQKRDRSLFERAERIKARAVRRLGQLLDAHMDETKISRRAAADAMGLTQSEASTSTSVSRIKHVVFEDKVESSPPMPLSRLAKLGMNPTGADESAPVWKVTERLIKLSREFPIAGVAQSITDLTPEQRYALKKALTPAFEWVDEVARRLGL